MKRAMHKINKMVAKLARLSWRPVFWKAIDNPSAPGGKVDMWLMVDDDTGDGIVSIGCPINRPDIPAYIADCCMNPWMAVPDDEGKSMTELAVRFNRAIAEHFKDEGFADAKEITVASLTIIEGYLADVPAAARIELVNNISARLQALRSEA